MSAKTYTTREKGMVGPASTDELDRGSIARGGKIAPTSADVKAQLRTDFRVNPWDEKPCKGASEAKGYGKQR